MVDCARAGERSRVEHFVYDKTGIRFARLSSPPDRQKSVNDHCRIVALSWCWPEYGKVHSRGNRTSIVSCPDGSFHGAMALGPFCKSAKKVKQIAGQAASLLHTAGPEVIDGVLFDFRDPHLDPGTNGGWPQSFRQLCNVPGMGPTAQPEIPHRFGFRGSGNSISQVTQSELMLTTIPTLCVAPARIANRTWGQIHPTRARRNY